MATIEEVAIRIDEAGPGHGAEADAEERVTPLELFFDLVSSSR